MTILNPFLLQGVLSDALQVSPVLFVDAFGTRGDGVTDDTTAIQNAINAASALGTAITARCPLLFTPGKKYALSSVNPKSYVDVYAYGAIFKKAAGAGNSPLFWLNPSISQGTPITQFGLRGVTMIGTGTESSSQGIVRIDQSTWIDLVDLTASNLAAYMINVVDSQWVWVVRPRGQTIDQAGGANAISFNNKTNGNTTPVQHIWCIDGYIDGCPTHCFAVVSQANANRTDPIVDAHFIGNTAIATGAGNAFAIEQGGGTLPPNLSTFDFTGNTGTQNGTGTYALSMRDGTGLSNDPLCISDVTIQGNRFYALQTGGIGIQCEASLVTIGPNIIHATTHDIVLQGHGTAIPHHQTVAGVTGHLGTGDLVHLNASGFDFATLTVEGNTRIGKVTVAVPGTGVAVAAVGYNRVFYIAAGASTVTMTLQDGAAIVVPASGLGTVRVPAGQTVTPTFASAPTWTVEGE